MVVNRVTARLVYCKGCNGRNTWERYPARDMKNGSGKIIEYCYRCRSCGAVTWQPHESEVRG